MADFERNPRSSESWTARRSFVLFLNLADGKSVKIVRFEPNTVLWTFHTIQPSSQALDIHD